MEDKKMSKKENKKVVEEVKEVIEGEVVEEQQAEEVVDAQLPAETENTETGTTEGEGEVVEGKKKFDPFHKIKENPKKFLADVLKVGAGLAGGFAIAKAMSGQKQEHPEVIEDAEFNEVVENEDVEVTTEEE